MRLLLFMLACLPVLCFLSSCLRGHFVEVSRVKLPCHFFWRLSFTAGFPVFWPFQSFCLLFHNVPWTWSCVVDVWIWTWHSMLSCFPYFDCLWVSVIVFFLLQREVSLSFLVLCVCVFCLNVCLWRTEEGLGPSWQILVNCQVGHWHSNPDPLGEQPVLFLLRQNKASSKLLKEKFLWCLRTTVTNGYYDKYVNCSW